MNFDSPSESIPNTRSPQWVNSVSSKYSRVALHKNQWAKADIVADKALNKFYNASFNGLPVMFYKGLANYNSGNINYGIGTWISNHKFSK